MFDKIIYLDHAAGAPVSDSVMNAMLPYFSDKFFNPSAPYLPAIEVRRDYENAKHQIAQVIGAKADELIMTAGATESINLAFSACSNDDEILVGEFEHHSVLNAAQKYGQRVLIKIQSSGIVNIEDLKAKISPRTKIVSVMLANNETGIIQPLGKVAEIIREERIKRLSEGNQRPIFLHCDASQGVGQIDINVARLGIDMLTLNAGKIYGPKQTGLLWAHRDISFRPQIVGGGQERGLRSGTENVPSVVGFARALIIADKHRKSEVKRLNELKKILQQELIKNFTDDEIKFIGNTKKQLASHLSVSFPRIDAERIVFALETKGVLLATGSACAANKGTRSQTLIAMGLSEEEADGSLRISMGKLNNPDNIAKAARIISQVVRAEIQRVSHD